MPKQHKSLSSSSLSLNEKAAKFKPIKDEIKNENIHQTPSKENVIDLPLTKRLFVGGIDKSITEQQIKERFINYGKVLSIQIINKPWKNSLFAYVELKAKNELLLHQCLSTLNMLTWKGLKFRVEYANPNILDKYKQERIQLHLDRKIKIKERQDEKARKRKQLKACKTIIDKGFYKH
ncbi:hypothetical protein ENUP19_0256G0006 [Entamoeba nuttalli]|uniref:RNA recognition motif domain containing protein n=2 Tax=Entamoeba nuttalli TaxID=412467 RepID=K2H3C6_ENTNP|nr:RNA recognition motif domain containing protein [Entamoeba nuttalli P19]EKE40872.1 RNA recognition motif domain containing protein [Entamoeba nuttalli P19]|eukprot:XP_008856798.1 RNA recognition motif domain containing protein [Entamoeba nuttalli P19]